MAVGLHVRASGLGVTLAERRRGRTWTVQSTPNPPAAVSSALNGVSCPSGSACAGVGQFFVRSGARLTLAERWNGSSWHIQPTPNPAGSSSSSLFAVACPAADRCTAVGSAASKLLVERWDGSGWRIQPAPVPSGAQFSELNAVSCTATACVAAGDYVNSSGLDVTLGGNPGLGAAYLFVRPRGGWRDTTQTAELTPAPNTPGTLFGYSVAIFGRTAVAGGNGAVWIFAEPPGGWRDMTQTAEITNPDFLGYMEALSRNTLAAGAPFTGAGTVDVYPLRQLAAAQAAGPVPPARPASCLAFPHPGSVTAPALRPAPVTYTTCR
jgi:hypothetical protein